MLVGRSNSPETPRPGNFLGNHILTYALGLEWLKVLNVTGLGVVYRNQSLTYSLEVSCSSQWHTGNLYS